jgi:hypothetical protein
MGGAEYKKRNKDPKEQDEQGMPCHGTSLKKPLI